MTTANNPLRQFFRRPAVHVKLPSGGKMYDASVIEVPESGELPVYPMTAIDDITVKTPDALFNGAAVADVIKSCIPSIKDPWKINSIDLDAILISIRIATSGDVLELESACPKCNEVGTHGIALSMLLASITPGDYEVPLTIGDLIFKFKPLTYTEMNKAALGQFDLQRDLRALDAITDPLEQQKKSKEALTSITETTMQVLTQTILSIQTPAEVVDQPDFILDFLHQCDKATYTKLRDYNTKLREKSEIQPLKMRCASCSNEYDQPFTLNTSDFFA
jgi:hypothetical protein